MKLKSFVHTSCIAPHTYDISERFKSGSDHCSFSIICEEFTVRMQALLSDTCSRPMRRAPRISPNDDDNNNAILTSARKLAVKLP